MVMMAAMPATSYGCFYVTISFYRSTVFTCSDVQPGWRMPKSSSTAEKSDEKRTDVGAHCKNACEKTNSVRPFDSSVTLTSFGRFVKSARNR